MNKKFTSGGVVTTSSLGNTIGAGMVGTALNQPYSEIIADGRNLILCYHTPGSKYPTYFCLKSVSIKDFQFNINHGDIPHGALDFSFFDSESKSFDIPGHIPKEQHTKYIMEQFDIEI
jgi:hypothetical protein